MLTFHSKPCNQIHTSCSVPLNPAGQLVVSNPHQSAYLHRQRTLWGLSQWRTLFGLLRAGSGACALYSPGLDSCRACLIHIVLPVVSCGSHGSAFSGDFGGSRSLERVIYQRFLASVNGAVWDVALWERKRGDR